MRNESTSHTTEDFFFREHYDFGEKLGKGRNIGSEDLFFREHHDFGEKLGKWRPLFSDDFAFIY